MRDNNNIKDKTRAIYEVLPKVDDRRCGYRSCGEFARAVAEGRAPCNGCISGGPSVAAKVCAIMGTRVPEETTVKFGPGSGFYRYGMRAGRGMGRGVGRGLGRGKGRGRGFA